MTLPPLPELRTAAQAAHIALTCISTHPTLDMSDYLRGRVDAAAAGLEAALDAVPAQPVAWLSGDGHPHHISALQTITERRIHGPWQPLYAAPQAVPVPAGWVPMHERAPDPDTECVVILRYSLDRPPFTAIDTWAMQREDPTGMGGPTMETGYGWNDNFDSDVIAWMPVLPHPPADWDQRLAMLAAAPKEQPHE